jgi:cytochrome c biogenesis protein CcdA
MFEEQLAIPVIVAAAALDSINPCVFGVLIFLLAFLMAVYKKPNKMLFAGLLYSAAVYGTYFLLGLGILTAVVGTGVTRAVYWLAAVIAILAGLLEIKDYFWYGKGFSLQMIPGAADRVKYYTEKIRTLAGRNLWLSYGMAFFLGIFVPLVELPCTGAPYFAILALIAEGHLDKAVPYLLLYNLVFVAPLFVIIGLVYFGKSSDKLEEWRKKHRGLMRLSIGLFLIALGAYMIYLVRQL